MIKRFVIATLTAAVLVVLLMAVIGLAWQGVSVFVSKVTFFLRIDRGTVWIGVVVAVVLLTMLCHWAIEKDEGKKE